MALPAFSSASAFGTSRAETSRMTMAVDMAQKPPIDTPSSARPTINRVKDGAMVTIMPDIISSPVRPSTTTRRSSLRVREAMNRLVSTAKMPDTDMA